MAQRILEPGQIETLAQASIPRIRLPDRALVFARRAARLRQLAAGSALGDYLRFLAALVDAQHAALAHLTVPPPGKAHIERSAEHGMPPIHPSTWPRPHAVARNARVPMRGARRPSGFSRRASATAFPRSAGRHPPGSRPRRPRYWKRRTMPSMRRLRRSSWPHCRCTGLRLPAHFVADEVKALDVPGVCPLCGTLPVASVVYAQSPYQGYRYLHCALCATEWHMVRVQCTQCGASGKEHRLPLAREHTPAQVERGGRCGGARGDLRAMPRISKDPLPGEGSGRRTGGRRCGEPRPRFAAR